MYLPPLIHRIHPLETQKSQGYGFHALELRFKILKGEPFIVPDEKKFDFSRILIGIYGKSYIGHPRLESLRTKNLTSNLRFKSGSEEAELFRQENYVGLHQSTLAKVDVIANICQLAYERELKTNASWWSVHCHSVKAFMNFVANHPYIAFLLFIASIFGNIVQFFDLTKG